MDVAGFTFKAAGWVSGIAEARLARWMPWVLLTALLGWRLWETGQEAAGWLADGPLELQGIALAGGLGVLVLVGIAWLAVRRLSPRRGALPEPDEIESDATRLAVPLVLSYTLPLGIVLVLTGVALAMTVLAFLFRPLVPLQDASIRLIGLSGNANAQWGWHVLVSLAALTAAVWLARRGQTAGALYLAILGLLDLKGRLSATGRPLDILNAAGPGNRADIWWVLLFAGLALYWLARRELTPRRASALAFVTLVTALLRQTDFISNRFSPFVDSSGLGFLAFGIVWDALTIGSWANDGSRGLPRVSRIFLYLGYVLMSVTVINWAVTSHDLEAVGHLTGDIGMVGLEAFGKPLLYTIFAITLAGAFRGDEASDPADPVVDEQPGAAEALPDS
jgi:hypothetical protein